jgi:hypothetical protein
MLPYQVCLEKAISFLSHNCPKDCVRIFRTVIEMRPYYRDPKRYPPKAGMIEPGAAGAVWESAKIGDDSKQSIDSC